MTDLAGLLRLMPQRQEETLRRLLVQFEQDGASDQIHRLEVELVRVKQQIDDVNDARDRLRLEKEALDEVIVAIVPGSSDMAAQEFRMILNYESEVRAQKIAKQRPDDLHEQKAEIKAEIERRRQLARLAARILR